MNFYQIQTKFRDEIRPRFGVMRSREFIMKDAYSFHNDYASLQETYELMHQTYCNIFDRLGLEYRPVLADSGSIGGDSSHEFHVLAESGEDAICFSDSSNFAANIERAETLPQGSPASPACPLEKIATPNQKTINEISKFLNIDASQQVKTIIVKSDEGGVIALALRGDHELNEVKAEKIEGILKPLTFATDEEAKKILGCSFGSIGVINLPCKLIVDYAAAAMSDFYCGANEDDHHLRGVNWERDVKEFAQADLRNVVDGDVSPDGKGKLSIKRGIEVGHIFQLGTKYSSAMNANIIGESGKGQTMVMGCYGIGVTRVIAAAIEQNYDDKGIIFPESIAPFQLVITPINYHKSHRVKNLADELYENCIKAKIDVLIDDRKERPGIMFADSELLGIPHRFVVSDTHADNGNVEYKARNSDEKIEVPYQAAVDYLSKKLIK